MTMTDRFKTSNGIVTDSTSGLEWEAEPAGPLTWQEAMDYAATLRLGGHDDWRVPTIEELLTLVDYSRVNPATDLPRMPSEWFWSSSSYAGSASTAWDVLFSPGLVNRYDKTNTYYVRCVRRPVVGPSGLGRLDALEKRMAALEARAGRTTKPTTKAKTPRKAKARRTG